MFLQRPPTASWASPDVDALLARAFQLRATYGGAGGGGGGARRA